MYTYRPNGLNSINVAMVYTKNYKYLNKNYPNKTLYYFFKKALFRHKKLNIVSLEHLGNKLDILDLTNNYDVVLLPNVDIATSLALTDINDYSIPVIARIGDPHTILIKNMLEFCNRCKIDCYFEKYSPSTFYKYYPKQFKYKKILFGVEPSLYKNVRTWEKRISDKIALSGVLDASDVGRRMYRNLVARTPKESTYTFHYKLRTKCNKLKYVIHTKEIHSEQGTADLPEILSVFKAAIAATTSFPTIKYMETPAAGCLTFMEVTEQNEGQHLGFEDGKNAIFINESNFTKKFREYLNNPDDIKWKQIADAGRAYTLNNMTNDIAAEALYNLMREVLGES